MTYSNFYVNWTQAKAEPGDIVEHFNSGSKEVTYRLVIDVQQETEHGALVTTLPISLSRNLLIRRIQVRAIKKAFK